MNGCHFQSDHPVNAFEKETHAHKRAKSWLNKHVAWIHLFAHALETSFNHYRSFFDYLSVLALYVEDFDEKFE